VALGAAEGDRRLQSMTVVLVAVAAVVVLVVVAVVVVAVVVPAVVLHVLWLMAAVGQLCVRL
jgi:hypothetical protein